MIPANRYIRTETAISGAINAVLSLVFFLLVFGFRGPVRVAGVGELAFDMLPQSFAIGLMATLVPGAITRARLARGEVTRLSGSSRLPAGLIPRALVVALVSVLIGVGVAALLLLLAPPLVGWGAALAGKIVYGAALGFIITPPGLRAALRAGPLTRAGVRS